jgi:hypothetical protein
VDVGVLQRFERRLEGLVSGAFAKAFKADVQPVEIASALQRELDDKAAIINRDATMVPNHFIVELSSHDYERLAMYAQTLCEELAEVVREHSAEQGYQLRGRAEVRFVEAEDLDIGVHRIRSSVVASVKPVSAPAPAPRAHRGAAHAKAETQVMVANPWLEVNGDKHPLTRAVTVLGRGTDVDLRVDDAGVSRRHAEIRAGHPVLLVDLGSTNGTTLDGAPIGRAELYDGARIGLGETVLVFRLPAG